jgi:hypothetical protein
MHEVENALTAYGTEQCLRDTLQDTLAQNRDARTLAERDTRVA